METATVTPDGTQASPASEQPASWIDAYVDWATKRSPLTPRHFHEGIAYTLATTAIGGRVYVQMPHEKVYPNLYTLVLGKTSIFAKTVAMGVAVELANRAMLDDRILRGLFTPEAFMNELSGRKPKAFKKLHTDIQVAWQRGQQWGARRTCLLDEAGRWLNSMTREYNAGMMDLLMALYDCKSVSRTTVAHGLTETGETAPSFLFATTPLGIGAMLKQRDFWGNGFWPRWNFLVETAYTPFTDAKWLAAPDEIVKPLLLPTLKSGAVDVSGAVVKAHNKLLEANRKAIYTAEDENIEDYLSRLHTKRLKAALIRAVLEGSPVIEIEHWEATGDFTQKLLGGVAMLRGILVNTAMAGIQKRIKQLLTVAENRTLPSRDIYRRLNLNAEEFWTAAKPLVILGELTQVGRLMHLFDPEPDEPGAKNPESAQG